MIVQVEALRETVAILEQQNWQLKVALAVATLLCVALAFALAYAAAATALYAVSLATKVAVVVAVGAAAVAAVAWLLCHGAGVRAACAVWAAALRLLSYLPMLLAAARWLLSLVGPRGKFALAILVATWTWLVRRRHAAQRRAARDLSAARAEAEAATAEAAAARALAADAAERVGARERSVAKLRVELDAAREEARIACDLGAAEIRAIEAELREARGRDQPATGGRMAPAEAVARVEGGAAERGDVGDGGEVLAQLQHELTEARAEQTRQLRELERRFEAQLAAAHAAAPSARATVDLEATTEPPGS